MDTADTPDALHSAAIGMRSQADRLDVITNNLANSSTIGFRARRWAASGFDAGLKSAVMRSQLQGALRHTGVRTDFALVGEGYFAVAASDGVRYTRDGRMSVDPDGHLCDAKGNKVLGSLGPAVFPRGAQIRSDGRIAIGERVIDRLRIVSLPGESNAADGYTVAGRASGLSRAKASVRGGYLEDSGVDPIAEMTSLVTTLRTYEANQKAAQRADETLRRAVIDVPGTHS